MCECPDHHTMAMNTRGPEETPKNPLEKGSDLLMTVIALAAFIAICGILVNVLQ